MEDPDETEDNTANDDPFEAHYEKTDAHQQRNGNHNAQFGLSCHATACYKVFEIILIEFGSLKPGVQFFGTSGKAEKDLLRKFWFQVNKNSLQVCRHNAILKTIRKRFYCKAGKINKGESHV